MWYVSWIYKANRLVATGTGETGNEFSTKRTSGEEGRLAWWICGL